MNACMDLYMYIYLCFKKCVEEGEDAPKMAKMRPYMAKMRPKMAKTRPKMERDTWMAWLILRP